MALYGYQTLIAGGPISFGTADQTLNTSDDVTFNSVAIPEGDVATLFAGVPATTAMKAITFTTQSLTVADTGADATVPDGTLTPTTGYGEVRVYANCQDDDGCHLDNGGVTIAETSMANMTKLTFTNIGTYSWQADYVAGNFLTECGAGSSLVVDSGKSFEAIYSTTLSAWVVTSNQTSTMCIVGRQFGVDAIDGTYSGNYITRTVTAGTTNAFGQAYHVHTDGTLIESDADVASAASMPVICLGFAAGTGSQNCLVNGTITETDWNWTVGGLIYAGDAPATTTGLTQTAPSTTGDQVQVLGVALTADTIYFNPPMVLVEVP